MAHKKKPATRGNAGRASDAVRWGTNGSEATKSIPSQQASYLRRRFGLAPQRAAIVATLAFAEARS